MESETKNLKLNLNLFKEQKEHFGKTYILTRMAFLLQHSYCEIRIEIDGKKYLRNLKTYLNPTLSLKYGKVQIWRIFRDLVREGYVERIEKGTDIFYTLTEKTWTIKNGVAQ